MRALAIVASSLIAGCATSQGPVTGSTDPAPAEFRTKVQDRVKATWKDPYSIRDASIAPPKRDDFPLPLPSGLWASGVWVSCIKANSKNSFGAYIGQKVHAAVFIDGQVAHILEAPRWDSFCADAVYAPFPEIEGRA